MGPTRADNLASSRVRRKGISCSRIAQCFGKEEGYPRTKCPVNHPSLFELELTNCVDSRLPEVSHQFYYMCMILKLHHRSGQ